MSTEHGLDQAFNSLDNQREAAQAYIKSQAHEGWRPVRERYDDGGFSGGSLDRPALQRLVADLRARRIDIVVVYKVDRLPRSLADFAKLVELFDAQSVSFVSVTQSFNTTSSMGRLTLNVLLSFAQFEREVTGERIRDKIAASKRKGIWVGGVVPLGYRLQDRKLVVEETEAATVRLVFERYLALESLPALAAELRERGIVTRLRAMSSGKIRGGVPLSKGPLQHLLRNRIYLGELTHRSQSYPAEHAAIVDRTAFDAVGERLDANRRARSQRRDHTRALLAGLLEDDQGHRMGPSYAVKKGFRYRYYVSSVLVQGRTDAGSVSRVPAPEIEAVVCDALQSARPGLPRPLDRDGLAAVVERITVAAGRIVIRLPHDGDDAEPDPIAIPWTPRTHHRRREILGAASDGASPNPIKAEARSRLLQGIARGRGWLDHLMAGMADDIDALATRDRLAPRRARMILSLAFIAPDIVEAAVAGTLPRGIGLSRLTDLPASWAEQRRQLGLSR